jgi:hypothetical protein
MYMMIGERSAGAIVKAAYVTVVIVASFLFFTPESIVLDVAVASPSSSDAAEMMQVGPPPGWRRLFAEESYSPASLQVAPAHRVPALPGIRPEKPSRKLAVGHYRYWVTP